MKKFIESMLSETGKISHKRFISVAISMLLIFMGSYATLHYREHLLPIFQWLCVFVLIMAGVATLPQVLALLRGTPLPKDDSNLIKDDINKTIGPRPDDREPGKP